MPLVEKSALVAFSSAQMFALVDDVERYPEFLPWCSGTQLLARDALITAATIEISYHGIHQSFSTANTKQGNERMQIALTEGPFKALEGEWQFVALGNVGCKVSLRLDYAFSNAVLESAVGPVFGLIANTMIERFVERADVLYGDA
jgi:ribosome-associated toxin RatA of RatAB toxin-antitoxin module